MIKTPLDWNLAYRRLRAAEQSLETALAENPVRTAAIWRERAIRLAQPPPIISIQAAVPVAIFRLAQELHAIELKDLAEVLPAGKCTPVPGAAPNFAGVINVRGQLLPVLDLAHFLGIPHPDPPSVPFALIARRPGRQLGLMIDRVERIGEIQPAELSSATGHWTRGIAPGPITLLNTDAILTAVFPGNEEKSRTA